MNSTPTTWLKRAEFADVRDAPRRRKTTIETRGKYRLIHASEGYLCGGLMAAWTEEHWIVSYTQVDGCPNGQRFATEAEARECLARWAGQGGGR